MGGLIFFSKFGVRVRGKMYGALSGIPQEFQPPFLRGFSIKYFLESFRSFVDIPGCSLWNSSGILAGISSDILKAIPSGSPPGALPRFLQAVLHGFLHRLFPYFLSITFWDSSRCSWIPLKMLSEIWNSPGNFFHESFWVSFSSFKIFLPGLIQNIWESFRNSFRNYLNSFF